MKSPFPGMDPFIEAFDLWGDFHNSLINEIRNDLAAQVPDGYVVRAGERTFITTQTVEEFGEEERAIQPDVSISAKSHRRSRTKKAMTVGGGPAIREQPVEMLATSETEHREAYLEIHALEPDRRLVTAVEMLSPTNKGNNSKGRKLYLKKRQPLLAGSANFVEIDLLRRGRRMPMAQSWPQSPYYLLVSRKNEAPRCKVWPAYSLRPLPAIPVPLDPGIPDLRLSIQPLIERTYRTGNYDSDIDYRNMFEQKLTEDEIEFLKRALNKLTR
jgi:hypothetical protein